MQPSITDYEMLILGHLFIWKADIGSDQDNGYLGFTHLIHMKISTCLSRRPLVDKKYLLREDFSKISIWTFFNIPFRVSQQRREYPHRQTWIKAGIWWNYYNLRTRENKRNIFQMYLLWAFFWLFWNFSS